MARARNIKPGFFENELLAECGFATRLMFIGLWTLADREGRVEDRPLRIKMQLFPADTIEAGPMLQDLADRGFIRRYQVGDLKCIQIVNFLVHQTPHATEKDSDLPDENGMFTVHERHKDKRITGQSKLVNSGLTVKQQSDKPLIPDSPNPSSLNPDSGILIPDSPSLRSGVATGPSSPSLPDVGDGVPAIPASKPSKPPKQAKDPPDSAATWAAYSEAFRHRYGVDPLRNATVNGQIAHLVSRLGKDIAPEVVRFYLRQDKRWYVEQRHSVGAMVRDAEALFASWQMGEGMTSTKANMADRTQTNAGAFGRLIEKARQQKSEVEA